MYIRHSYPYYKKQKPIKAVDAQIELVRKVLGNPNFEPEGIELTYQLNFLIGVELIEKK